MSSIEKDKQQAEAERERAEKLKARKERSAQADAEWDRTFENSRGALKKLADKARKEHREGHTEELDPDNL